MSLRSQFVRDVAKSPLHGGPRAPAIVTEEDLFGLPPTVRRYFEFMRVVGRPRDWSFKAGFTGRFRTSPTVAWDKCEAWQYDSAIDVARIFQLRIRIGGVIPIIARDTYVNGRGLMKVKSLKLFS